MEVYKTLMKTALGIEIFWILHDIKTDHAKSMFTFSKYTVRRFITLAGLQHYMLD